EARQNAIDAIQPEVRSFEQGQVVVEAGKRITELDIEALNALGLMVSQDMRLQLAARGLLAALLVTATTSLYITRRQPDLLTRFRLLWLLEGIFLIVVVSFAIFSGDDIPQYLFPYAVLGLLFVGLIGTEFAVFAAVLLALLVGIMANNSSEMTAIAGFGGIVGVLSLQGTDRLNRYFFVGLVLACVNVVVVVIFSLGLNVLDAGVFARLIGYGLLNGVLAAMAALVGLYLITLIFNMPTSIKLVELSQPSTPLLQRLLREAPGTYQHSLQVANLAEQAANAIGANAELVRVAALYHDIGKILNPAFFVENQVDGSNPHDLLNDPFRSAAIIISHVSDGDRLARQYRLPARIRDFIWEHHGMTRVSYFLSKSLSEAENPEQVDVDLFTYPGPKPQSRETALIMLADSSESIVRARKPANKQEISTIIREIVESRIADGQLNESTLTLKDIEQIRMVFVEMLQGVFHPRINYPGALPRLNTGEIPRVSTANDGRPDTEIAGDTVSPMISAVSDVNDTAIVSDDDAPLADVPPLRRPRSNAADTSEMLAAKQPEGERDDVSG
ncbi:MAG: HDIG domain-containing protein, partial [Anaerolineae bacterium]|nr:HDIG domain-containing protein [Anaerolineae bacterium]